MDVVSNVSDQTHVVQSTRGLGKNTKSVKVNHKYYIL